MFPALWVDRGRVGSRARPGRTAGRPLAILESGPVLGRAIGDRSKTRWSTVGIPTGPVVALYVHRALNVPASLRGPWQATDSEVAPPVLG